MTQQWRTERPGADEHAPYYGPYVAEAPEGDLLEALGKQTAALAALMDGLPESKGGHRYAEGKWSIKEVIAHVTDAERVFSYRLLRFARGDRTELPGFDEGKWAPESGAESRTLEDLVDEFVSVRRASVALIRSMPDEAMERRGTASGKEISARALAWIMAGHFAHHARVLRERYL
jgi:hypothetical protein